jgi:hypothetical protein
MANVKNLNTKKTLDELHEKILKSIMSADETTRYFYVLPSVSGVERSVNISAILKDTKKKSNSISDFYRNETINKEMGNLINLLRRYSPAVRPSDDKNGWVIAENDLPDIIDYWKQANALIDVETQDFKNNYDEHVECFKDYIKGLCKENSKARMFPQIWKQANGALPSKEEIHSEIKMQVKPIMSPVFENYIAGVESLVKETSDAEAKNIYNGKLQKICEPVIINLAVMNRQIIEREKLHASTVDSYRKSVEILSASNKAYLKSLPELDGFVKLADAAVDAPADATPLLLAGFMHFYYQNGLLDIFPYSKVSYDRAFVELIGKNHDNSFTVLGQLLEPKNS